MINRDGGAFRGKVDPGRYKAVGHTGGTLSASSMAFHFGTTAFGAAVKVGTLH